MKERPIIFTDEMVLAILEGRKTQTRRVVKPQPIEIGIWKQNGEPVFATRKWNSINASSLALECRYGVPGDRLWVREALVTEKVATKSEIECGHFTFKADEEGALWSKEHGFRTIPARFMPRWASRIMLEVVRVRVERVQAITYYDCIGEGIVDVPRAEKRVSLPGERPIEKYRALWDAINAKRGWGWEVNPWVWVVEFKKKEA